MADLLRRGVLVGSAATLALSTLLALTQIAAQPPAGGARAAPENWWVEKTRGGVYNAPMKPLWKLADLKAMHPGQHTWTTQIIKDPEQEAYYSSAAPGTAFGARMHPDTPTLFVVIAGTMTFHVEGQPDVLAKRGSLVNILKTTVFSYEATGDQDALYVEVDPRNYKTVYPAAGAQPKAMAGGQIVKIAFAHTPDKYSGVNKLHYNTFDGIAACDPPGVRVMDDHIFSSPLLGYVNPADNKCGTGRGNVGNAPLPGGAPLPKFDPKSTFGHMHAGPAEWWIVQVGEIIGKFENSGEYHAQEGDVLYAAPMSWHQMAAAAPSGPSVRLAMGGYQLINMNNTSNTQ